MRPRGNPSLHRRIGIAVATLLCVAYIIAKIDFSETVRVLRDADPTYVVVAMLLILATVPPMAWRWRWLLAARGVEAPFSWLTRTYLVAYTVAQVLPTSLGGDASRIYSVTRRFSGTGEAATGSVLLERALGGATTLALAAVGFVLAIGQYDVGAYIWIEAVLVVATIAGAVGVFSTRVRRRLAPLAPAFRRVGLERPVRTLYDGLHGYRSNGPVLARALVLTTAIQTVRIIAIWLLGKACGVDLSPRPYFVLGPLLLLVMLIPFTINGLAFREAFFVSFLGQLGVDADKAFATGFLFFLSSLLLALPGALILLAESVGGKARRTPHGSET